MAVSRWVLLLGALATIAAAEYAMEGEHYSLSCTSNDDVMYWMIQGNGKAFRTGPVYEEEKIEVFPNGTIHFMEVRTDYDGVHLCVTMRQGDITGHGVKMTVRPKPSDDLWADAYKAQFITGLVAAIVCALIFTGGCLVFRFRYREPKAVLLNAAEEAGHFNPALDVEGGDNYNTKM